MTDLFMGEPQSFWQELRRRFEQTGSDSFEKKQLLNEIVELRGRVSFYEARIVAMEHVRANARKP